MSRLIAILFVMSLCLLSYDLVALAIRQDVSVNAVYGSPEIDGKLDDLYQKSDAIIVKNFANFANSGTDEHLSDMATAEGHLLWDESNLYYFFTVKDMTPIKTLTQSGSTDAIELAFDFENTLSEEARPISYGDNGLFLKTAPYAKALGYPEGEALFHDGFSIWAEELRYSDTYKVSTSITETGYTVEAKIPLNDMVKSLFKVGYSFGLGVSILDDVDDDGMRDLKITWGSNDGDIQAGSILDISAACDKVVLAAAPAIEELIEDIVETAEENPDTSDTLNFLFLTYAVIFLSVFSYIIKRKLKTKN